MKINESKVFNVLGLDDSARDMINHVDMYRMDGITQDLGEGMAIFKLKKDLPYKPILEMMIDKGYIIVCYRHSNKDDSTAPFIPYTDSKGTKRIIINITTFIDKVKSDVEGGASKTIYEISYEKVYALLCTASGILTAYMNNDFISSYAAKNALIKVDSELWLQSLNRISSLSAMAGNAEYFKYIHAKYLLSSVYKSMDSDGVAIKLSGINDYEKVSAFNIKFPGSVLSRMSVEEYIDGVLKKEFPAFQALSLSALIQSFSILYTPQLALTIDYLPYVSGLILSRIAKYKTYSTDIFTTGNIDKVIKEVEPLIHYEFEKVVRFLK